MLQTVIGLTDATDTMDHGAMSDAATALNIQVSRDLPQFWPATATVTYVADITLIPQGVWPVMIVSQLDDGEAGIHLTAQGQPYAKVLATAGSVAWVRAASHEIIEMLIDPAGTRQQISTAIAISADGTDVVDALGSFEYLVEACDPCEADACGYKINNLPVSDFLTPNYYDLMATAGTHYSFNQAITRPRQILRGGYISWTDPLSDNMMQIDWSGAKPEYKNLGHPDDSSLRRFVDGTRARGIRKSSTLAAMARTPARDEAAERRRAAAAFRSRRYI